MNPASRKPAPYRFRLYVAGDAANSALALVNLKALCMACLPDQHHIEVVDVFREPARALADGILMTPMLIRLEPAPIRRVVGTLSDALVVRQIMGLDAQSPVST